MPETIAEIFGECQRALMHMRASLIFAMALALPAPLLAQAQAAPISSERRLSPDEVERVLADAAARREAAEESQLKTGPQISGEIGVGIGSGGYRSAYGAADVQLDDGFASFSFYSERSRNRFTRHPNH